MRGDAVTVVRRWCCCTVTYIELPIFSPVLAYLLRRKKYTSQFVRRVVR